MTNVYESGNVLHDSLNFIFLSFIISIKIDFSNCIIDDFNVSSAITGAGYKITDDQTRKTVRFCKCLNSNLKKMVKYPFYHMFFKAIGVLLLIKSVCRTDHMDL